MRNNLTKYGLATLLLIGLGSPSFAQDPESYISGFGGLAIRSDSVNTGEFTSDFTTGEGTTIPAGTVIPNGTSLGWESDFDLGYHLGFAYGMSTGSGFRSEAEVRYLRNDIGSHRNVTVGGGAIGTEDAGVLVTGSGNLGVTVRDLVADGRGHSDTWSFMGNAYFDFNPSGMINPYVGGGLGYATTQVTFEPSGVPAASDRDGGLAYQGIVGVDFGSGDGWRIFGEYRYFGTSDVETSLSLLPATLKVESESNQFNGGIRFHF